jgi:hypothetical protein
VNDAIDLYLGTLTTQLDRREVDAARLIEEAEEHLRDCQAALIDAGWHADAAATVAVERFGGPDIVARRLPLIGGPVGRQVIRALAPLVAVAMVATGVGGVLALFVAWIAGHEESGVSLAALWAQALVGVFGLGVLESMWRRRSSRPPRPSGLPARFVPAAGLLSFGLATAVLGAYGVLLVWWDRSHHMPRPLLTALSCLGVAVFYGMQLRQRRVAGQA